MLEGIPVIDAHHHFWQLERSYPWLQGKPDPDRFTGDDSPIRVDYLPSDLRHDFSGLDLVGSVHVDAGAGDAAVEASWLQDLHDAEGLPTVVVAAANLLNYDAPAHLERISELSAVRGVRHILNWHPNPNFSYVDRDDVVTDARWLQNFARLAPLGLSFDLQIYPAQMADAAALAQAHPETRIVLNHTGMPLGLDDGAVSQWRTGIALLAAQPNVAIKISGIGMTIHPWTVDTFRPFVDYTVESFTPQRAMFASNFPVDRLYSSLDTLFEAFDQLTAYLTVHERRALFADTAREIYRIDDLRQKGN